MTAFSETIKNLGPARVAILGATMLSLIVFFIFVSAKVSEPSMSILYRDLATADSSQVAARLEEAGIKYRVSPDGAQIFTPKPDIGRARMLLAEAGLPNGGSLGYEIFDQQTSFGTTSFVQNINQVRALQGELAKTISSLEPVQFAKVLLVLPQRELFSRETRNASASVTLKLMGSSRLSREQIYGIQNLVANSVPDLQADNVTIIDSDANMLAGGGDEDPSTMMGLKAEELRRSYEKRLVNSIEDLVGRTVGFNKVRATVTADLDFDRISTNDEIFDPEGQVVRSTQSITEENTERDAQNTQDVTVQNNLPGLDDGFDANAAPSLEGSRTEEITNFEISKTIRNTVRESGEVTRLSVAVLVDGRYTTNEEGERIYEPRSQEEIEQLESLVRSAVGFDAQRGDVIEIINMPFADVATDFAMDVDLIFGFERTEIIDISKMLMLVALAILVVLLVIRPLVNSVVQTQKASLEQAKEEAALLSGLESPAALTGPSNFETSGQPSDGTKGGGIADGEEDEDDDLIDMQTVEGKVKASSVKKVGDIVSSHPNETVSVLRNWMTQE